MWGEQLEFRTFERRDLNDVIGLCKAERWESYVVDPERTYRALSAPGVITVVAVEKGKVLGFAQSLTDGAIRAYLANMVVLTRPVNVDRASDDDSFKRSSLARRRFTSIFSPPTVPMHSMKSFRTIGFPAIGCTQSRTFSISKPPTT